MFSVLYITNKENIFILRDGCGRGKVRKREEEKVREEEEEEECE